MSPDDPLELEADRVADLFAPETESRTAVAPPVDTAPASAVDVLASSGRPLDLREQFAFGIDLAPVRLHDGEAAKRSASALAASAYTVGDDVVLGEGYVAGTPSGRRLLAHELAHVAQQRTAGGRAPELLLRQPQPPQGQPASEYDAVYDEIWALEIELSKLVNKQYLTPQLNAILVDLGGPGEKPDAEVAAVRARLEAFKAERESQHRKVMEWWPELTADYRQEDERLAQSADETDARARTLLHERYVRAQQELTHAGRYADPYDVMPFADYLYDRRHLTDAWEGRLRESLDVHERHEAHWPWKGFESTTKLIEAAAKGGHISEELREQLLGQLDRAIKQEIHEAVTSMMELGESPLAAREWAAKAERASKEAAEDLANRFVGRTGRALERWHARLHIAGVLTVAIDVVGSILDVATAPPKERPKRFVVQSSRLLGGFAGARIGASAGASFGEEFGPEGAVIGGAIGGFLGGLEGSIFAEQVAEFVADEIWPPEDTFDEILPD